jgi:myo-inositol-1-phosphate synthase
MTLRRRKSKKAKAADAVGSYLKLKTAGKAAKGAKKAAEGTAAYQVAKRTPLVRRIPVIAAGAGVAAFAAAKLLRSGDDRAVSA